MAKKKVTRKKEDEKVMSKFEKGIQEKRKTNLSFSYPESTIIGGIKYVREDVAVKYANSIPEEIKDNFLIKRQKREWYNWKRWLFGKWGKEIEFEPKGNMLFLMDNDGNIRVYDKVQSGYFRVNDNYDRGEKGKINDKYIILKPNKLRTIVFEDEDEFGEIRENYLKAWVADVNNVNALPENPAYDCEDVSEFVNKAVIGNREFTRPEKKGGFTKWLPWVFGGIAILTILYMMVNKNIFGLGDMLGVTKQAVTTTTQTIVQNASSGSVPGGTLS